MPCHLGERITKSNRPQSHGLTMRTSAQGWMRCFSTHLSHSHSNPTPNHKDLSSRGERRDWGLKSRVCSKFSSKECLTSYFATKGYGHLYSSPKSDSCLSKPRNFRSFPRKFHAAELPRACPELLSRKFHGISWNFWANQNCTFLQNHHFGAGQFLVLLGCLCGFLEHFSSQV